MTFEDFFALWNENTRSRLKRHRLIAPLKSNKLLMARWKKSLEDGISEQIIKEAMAEACWLMLSDDFWRTRVRKQGIPWFLQERKSDGLPVWVWLYESRMERKESEEENNELHENVFKFDKTNEELP